MRHSPPNHQLARPLVGAMLFLLVAATTAVADCRRPGDRVLLVSTRPVGCSTDPTRVAEGIFAAEHAGGRWNPVALDALIDSLDPTLPIVVYVHGNQIDASNARRRGRDVYRRLVRCADERPLQFVVFSWCSSKVPGLLKDFRVKAERTRPVGWQLAWLVDRMPAGARIGMLGYSYGARVTSGAAHLLAGGSLSGLSLERCGGCDPVRLRAVFMAAAYDADWNSPRRYHGRSLNAIETLLSTVDPRDPAMKYYKWVPRLNDPPAMGGVGPKGLTRSQAARVRLMTVTSSVGKSHDLYDYLEAPGLMPAAWRRLTFAGEAAALTIAGVEVASAR